MHSVEFLQPKIKTDETKNINFTEVFLHIRTVQLDIIKVLFIHQLKHQCLVLKTILKFTLQFTLKQFRNISVLQLHHHQGTQ